MNNLGFEMFDGIPNLCNCIANLLALRQVVHFGYKSIDLESKLISQFHSTV